MVNYQNGKIYKIVNDELNLTYYGSTCSTLTKRLSCHRTFNTTTSTILFSTETKPEIFLVEKFPCNDKMELHQRERFYIENNECVNKDIPGRTLKEYYEDTREQRKEYSKKYREDNKEKIKEQNKKYKEENKEKIKEQNKKYIEENKEKIKARNKQYREQNKEKIREYDKQRYLKKKLLKSQSD